MSRIYPTTPRSWRRHSLLVAPSSGGNIFQRCENLENLVCCPPQKWPRHMAIACSKQFCFQTQINKAQHQLCSQWTSVGLKQLQRILSMGWMVPGYLLHFYTNIQQKTDDDSVFWSTDEWYKSSGSGWVGYQSCLQRRTFICPTHTIDERLPQCKLRLSCWLVSSAGDLEEGTGRKHKRAAFNKMYFSIASSNV